MVRDYILPLFHVSQISRWYRFWNWLITLWFKFIEGDGKSRQMGVCRYQWRNLYKDHRDLRRPFCGKRISECICFGNKGLGDGKRSLGFDKSPIGWFEYNCNGHIHTLLECVGGWFSSSLQHSRPCGSWRSQHQMGISSPQVQSSGWHHMAMVL